ncbi:asparagine synthase (glutamine-hydrolyzing) [Streptomyces bambusae]|uniref:asparagine synthase (glutamine-hydrolyzing) n=1 Tax=Streptomyces bambusae TaxID=1550616 RepID=UPI001CFC4BCE|nr:asparagine synthase (glutamine-hydrolyzing) [Streptomyces bambusae]MCB5165698.1 asparagine synthase (glutamine-hydrolyzing) [Streptomyces bambusae]
MCRIHGYFNATAGAQELRTVAALQRHGGPDGTGQLTAPRWGLGNNRLALVDLDGGAQPYGRGGPVQVVFNGEIYNHNELRRTLEGKGHTFADRCDGSILPALYEEYGDAFTEHLEGMYAVALLDLRAAAPRLLLATDHIGMKPLYYRWDPAARSLHFASELPALLGFGGLPHRADPRGLDAYLATRTPFGTATMYDGISVLAPATTLSCVLGELPRTTTRTPAPPPSPRLLSPALEDHALDVRRTLRAEVARMLQADVPVAVITSGGLDSSLITALAAEHGGPLHSFNIAYRGTWPFDERHYAREVADHTGTVHHQIEIDPAAFPQLIEDTVASLGQPNADPITLSSYALFAAVRAAGFKAVLTGDAADEVFGGYDRMRHAATAAASGRAWADAYLDHLAVLPARLRHTLYTPEYRAFVQDTPVIAPEATAALLHGEDTVQRRITDFELGQRLPAYHLRRVDHLSMAHSVEARLPFCQPRVVALGRRLPDRLRIHLGQVKRTLYAASDGLLPAGVLQRPKQPFTLPVTAMLAPGTPLWEYARDTLHPAAVAAGGQLAPDAVDGLFRRQAQAPDDTTALTLWALLVHEVWRASLPATRRLVGAAA